jgi:hypothetical protein
VAGLDALVELPALAVVGALAAVMAAVVVVGTVDRAAGRLRVDPL